MLDFSFLQPEREQGIPGELLGARPSVGVLCFPTLRETIGEYGTIQLGIPIDSLFGKNGETAI